MSEEKSSRKQLDGPPQIFWANYCPQSYEKSLLKYRGFFILKDMNTLHRELHLLNIHRHFGSRTFPSLLQMEYYQGE